MVTGLICVGVACEGGQQSEKAEDHVDGSFEVSENPFHCLNLLLGRISEETAAEGDGKCHVGPGAEHRVHQ